MNRAEYEQLKKDYAWMTAQRDLWKACSLKEAELKDGLKAELVTLKPPLIESGVPAALPAEVEEAMDRIEEAIREAFALHDIIGERTKHYEFEKDQAALAVIRAALTKPPIRVTSWHLHEWATGFDEDISHNEHNLRDIFHELGIAVDGEGT